MKVTGVPTTGMTMTVLMRGSNRLVLDEAERSVHDALCVVRSLVSVFRFASEHDRRTCSPFFCHVSVCGLPSRQRICLPLMMLPVWPDP